MLARAMVVLVVLLVALSFRFPVARKERVTRKPDEGYVGAVVAVLLPLLVVLMAVASCVWPAVALQFPELAVRRSLVAVSARLGSVFARE